MTNRVTQALTQEDRELIQKVFSSPLDIPLIFKNWLKAWLEADPPRLPASGLLGYSPLTAVSASVATEQSTASTSYTNLGTTGPELTDLAAGQYILQYGFMGDNDTAGAENFYSPSINGAAALDANACQWEQAGGVTGQTSTLSRSLLVSLPNQSNSVLMKYRVGAGTGDFRDRWLIALRTGNL